jgi:hypothetical protein
MVLKGMGWDSTANNPYDTFKKLAQYFEKGAADTHVKLLQEFAAIRRSSYDKMAAFQLRINFLRERLNSTEFRMTDKAYLWLVIKGIEEEYPDLYGRMVSGLDAGTVSWNSLMAELQQLAVTEEAQPSMASLKMSTKDKDKNNRAKDGRSRGNDEDMVKCRDCDQKCHHDAKLCKACGRHYKGDTCWWCEPEKAPDSWFYKKKALKRKKEAKSTTAPLHQQSGVSNPTDVTVEPQKKANTKPANVFFTTNNYDDDDEGSTALVNLPIIQAGFCTGPQRQ